MGRRPLKGRATTNTTPEHPEAPAIVAFDFDGTITARDSYTAFLRWRAGSWRYWVGMVRLLPSAVTVLGLQLSGLLGGTVIIEQIFSIPGLGSFLLQGITNTDMPVIMGVTAVFVLVYMTFSLLVDIVYGFLNPKVRVG